MNVSAHRSWETSYTTTDDNTFHSSDEPRRIYFLPPSPSPPPSPPKSTEKEEKPGNVLSKRRGSVAAHLRSLRSDDSPSKGHPRPINQKLRIVPVSKLTSRTMKLTTLFNNSCILIVCKNMGTYIYVPPLMHKYMNRLRRWHVAATCHPTLFYSWKST